MANTISFKIKVDDSNSFKVVTADADELGEAIASVSNQVDKLNGSIVNWSNAAQAAEQLSSVFSRMESAISSLTTAYAAQIEAEAKLTQVMRNTMDASDEEIESIKQLCSEQQKLGIVGDEVQLAAAQELATYLSLSDSLKAIIPTMNDMIAQQLGMGASAESATQIATMLGKVMAGQTSALSRYGYEFNEAQEYVLKFGNELERAQVLCDVVSESVGGVNRATARTDAGQMQQLANAIGDVRERIGAALQVAQPFVTKMATIGQASTGVMQLYTSLKSLSSIQVIANANTKLLSAGMKMLGITAESSAVSITVAKVAVAALYATLTLGITIAINALVELFGRLGQKGKEAADGVNDLKAAQDAYSRTSADISLDLAEETLRLEDLIKKKKDTTAAVGDLNARYGQIFGSHKTAAEWYDVLTKKSAAYARQLGIEAQIKVLSAQEGEKIAARDQARGRSQDLYNELQSMSGTVIGRVVKKIKLNGKIADAEAEVKSLSKEVAQLDSQLQACYSDLEKVLEELGDGGNAGGSGVPTSGPKTIRDIGEAVEEYSKAVQTAVDINRTFNAGQDEMTVRMRAMKSGITSLIETYGVENASVQQLISEYKDLRQARLGSAIPKVTSGDGLSLPTLASTSAAGPQQQIPSLSGRKTIKPYTFEETTVTAEDAAGAISALGEAMGSLSGVLGDSAAGWLQWGANVLQAVGKALPVLATLFAANSAVAGAEGAAAMASIPYVGPVLAIAAVASIAAAIAALPKFASGGIAYGPTLGLFGEYSGASNNPEVVAPLDRLRELITPGGTGYGKVEFLIDGRRLKGVLQKVNRLDSRNNG